MLRLSPVAFGWQQAQGAGQRRHAAPRTQAASALVVSAGHDASDHLFHWHRRISRRDQDQHRLMDDKADSPDATPMFSGTPRKYRRKIGRAHVRTTVTNEHLVCRFLLENKKS